MYLQCEGEKERRCGRDVEVRLRPSVLGSPCHAGHTAGCHHGTFPSLLWLCCCSLQLCGHAPPSPSPSLLLHWSVHFLFLAGTHRMDRERRGEAEGRQTGGHFGFPPLREAELQGHGEERQGGGGHPGRSGWCFCLFSFLSLLCLIRADFPGAALLVFWGFNLPNWPPRQTDSHTASPPLLPRLLLAVFGHTLRHHSLCVDGLMLNLLFFPSRLSVRILHLHPSVTVLSSVTLEVVCFFLQRPPAVKGSLSGQSGPQSAWLANTQRCLPHVWMKICALLVILYDLYFEKYYIISLIIDTIWDKNTLKYEKIIINYKHTHDKVITDFLYSFNPL